MVGYIKRVLLKNGNSPTKSHPTLCKANISVQNHVHVFGRVVLGNNDVSQG